MNEDQFSGAARNLGGKVEDEFGKIVGNTELRREGIIDQVAGTAQNLYGDAKEMASTAYRQMSPAAREGADRVVNITRENTVFAVLAAGAVGYALSWAFHANKSAMTTRDR